MKIVFVRTYDQHIDSTFLAKTEAVLIGLSGTFLVNILRMVFTVVILAVSWPLFAVVFHDYLAAIVTVVWLFGFWWFAYSFVLEERRLGTGVEG